MEEARTKSTFAISGQSGSQCRCRNQVSCFLKRAVCSKYRAVDRDPDGSKSETGGLEDA